MHLSSSDLTYADPLVFCLPRERLPSFLPAARARSRRREHVPLQKSLEQHSPPLVSLRRLRPPSRISPPLYCGLTPAGCSHVQLRCDLFSASLEGSHLRWRREFFRALGCLPPSPKENVVVSLLVQFANQASLVPARGLGLAGNGSCSPKTSSCEEFNAATISRRVGEWRNQHGVKYRGTSDSRKEPGSGMKLVGPGERWCRPAG